MQAPYVKLDHGRFADSGVELQETLIMSGHSQNAGQENLGLASPAAQPIGPASSALTADNRSLRKRILHFVLIGLLALSGWLYVHFSYGSLATFAAYLNGDRFIVRPAVLRLEQGHVGEVRELSFSIINLTGRDVVVIGASVSCACIATESFPLRIPAGHEHQLAINARLGPKTGEFRHTLNFVTDCNDSPTFAVYVEGTVIE